MFTPEMTHDNDGAHICAPMLGEIDGASPTAVLVSALSAILADVQKAERRDELVEAVLHGAKLDGDDLAWLAANSPDHGQPGGDAFCAIQALQELIELASAGAFGGVK